jgi:surfactin synthase thioesterase subunit
LIKNAKVPIALYVGKDDILVNTEDQRWIASTLGDTVVDYKEVDGGHLQFFVG